MNPTLEELSEMPAQWLRDNCECVDCRHPRNGQRLRSVLELPDDVVTIGSRESDRIIQVEFSDGHLGTIRRDAIENLLNGSFDPRCELSKVLWDASLNELPRFDWNDYLSDYLVKEAALSSVVSHGFCILRGVPTQEREVLKVIETFGFVRVTNYGELFDVRVEDDPNNLAFTSLAILPHTDNPYRNPVPSIQLLHCLDTTVAGGESGLVDGFLVASKLRDLEHHAFDLLTSTSFIFKYENATTHLQSHSPIIELTAEGQITGIRWNDRSISPPLEPENSLEIFNAMRAFAKIANDPEMEIKFRLEPGDCVIFDNTRLMHSRTAYESSGSRHLQGAYADLDSLQSTLAVMNRWLA